MCFPISGKKGGKMKDRFELGYIFACHWWRRSDLELKPADIERVGEVLRDAGIEVYSISPAGWLTCEPRPLGVREALSGELVIPEITKDYPPEEPGKVLALLAKKNNFNRVIKINGAKLILQLIIARDQKVEDLQKNLHSEIDLWFQDLQAALKDPAQRQKKVDEEPPAVCG